MDKKWWTLVTVAIGVFMLLLDITIVNVALSDIQRQLHASLSDLQWVIDAYAVAMLIVLEALSPAKRSAFLLHDVFGYSFAEVADIVGRTPRSRSAATAAVSSMRHARYSLARSAWPVYSPVWWGTLATS